MNILITNDDGVEAKQLLPLIRRCQKLGQVTTVVPRWEQSGRSHCIETQKPFTVFQTKLDEDVTVWVAESSPSDCVRYACLELEMNFDLVISGINRGYNLGQDCLYSGTLAAATEAASRGIPALALSSSIQYYDRAVGHLEEILAFLEEKKLMQLHSFYSINIPDDPKGILITRQGGPCFFREYLPIGKHNRTPVSRPIPADRDDLTRDTGAALNGYISITPMTADRTDFRVYEALAGGTSL